MVSILSWAAHLWKWNNATWALLFCSRAQDSCQQLKYCLKWSAKCFIIAFVIQHAVVHRQYRGVAKFGIALGSGPRGLGFKSRHSDQKIYTRGNLHSCIDFLVSKIKNNPAEAEKCSCILCWCVVTYLSRINDIRVWRSLVSRLNGVQEAAGSNPVTRTMSNVHKDSEHSGDRSNRKIAPIFLFIRLCG